MKKALRILLMSPLTIFASHSIDIGSFYSIHKEPNYRYNLGGIAISYEIGNSKGLKATGKMLLSSNSDLLFIHSRSEFRWYLPYEQFEFFPFWGCHYNHHQVMKREGMLGSLNRSYGPLGLGFKHNFENLFYEVTFAHLHPLTANFIYDENTADFWGKKLYLPHSFLVDTKLSYKAKDHVNINLDFRYTGDYYQTIHDISVELSASVGF